MRTSLVKAVCKAAIEQETGELEDIKRRQRISVELRNTGIDRNSIISPTSYRHIINITGNPISLASFKSFDPNIRATKGLFSIQFVGPKDKRYIKDHPYIIGQDLIRMRVACRGYWHWKLLCERIPELAWVDKYSTITRKLFLVAAQHPGMSFMFAVDWVRYSDMIFDLAEKMGTKLEGGAFVSYKCSKSEYESKYRDKLLCDIRAANQVSGLVNEAERLAAAHPESGEGTGE